MGKFSSKDKNIVALICILILIFVSAGLSINYIEVTPSGSGKSPSRHSTGDSGDSDGLPQELLTEFEQAKPLVIEKIFPAGKMIGTSERNEYTSETMSLIIPKLILDCLIQNGTDTETLKKGPGLYEYAQMPSIKNANVRIAGHRDIHGSHFYDLDKLADGDLLYLIYDRQIFEYEYLNCNIFKADDWSAIRISEISCLTLTTCDPIGTSLNRLIVTAQLAAVYPYNEHFEYADS